MGYVLPSNTRVSTWWRRVPHLPLPGWEKVHTRIRVEPRSPDRERWDWSVTLVDASRRPDPMFRPGGPDRVVGRTRDEGLAWQRAREVVDDFRARYAAEQLRLTMVRHQRVPQ